MPTYAAAAETVGKNQPCTSLEYYSCLHTLTMGSLPIIAFVKPLGAADWLHFLVHLKAIFRVTTPGDLGNLGTGQGYSPVMINSHLTESLS